MAYIEGIVNTQQLEGLFKAGYLTEEIGHQPKEKYLHRVSVWVDCAVNDLLTPPICQRCGTFMGDGEHLPDPIGGTHRWECPNCNLLVVIEIFE